MTTNIINIGDHEAVVSFDPDIAMFRGEFVNLNGGADFYSDSVDGLRKEAKTSLNVYLEMCEEEGIEPSKHYSGKFNLRINPSLHAKAATRAKATGQSLNNFIEDMIDQMLTALEQTKGRVKNTRK